MKKARLKQEEDSKVKEKEGKRKQVNEEKSR